MSLRCPDGRQINSTNERQWEVFDVGSAVVSLLFMGARQDALATTGPKIRVPVPRRGAAYDGGGGVRIAK
jgi:hypothetical protein